MRSFDKPTAKYWCEWLEVGLENTPVRETWREREKMVATYFPGRGTLFEETYLEGKAESWFDRSLTATTAEDLFTDA